MPTIVGILTFISMIIQHLHFKARKVFFAAFSFYEQLKFHAYLVEHEKSFLTSSYNLEY